MKPCTTKKDADVVIDGKYFILETATDFREIQKLWHHTGVEILCTQYQASQLPKLLPQQQTIPEQLILLDPRGYLRRN